jgi:hypothetical protein
MASTADVLPDLVEAAKRTVRASPEVQTITRFYKVCLPLEPGDPTEVLLIGRVPGEQHAEPLTASLTDDPPGFSSEVRITRGW